jgi:hypothetical protein
MSGRIYAWIVVAWVLLGVLNFGTTTAYFCGRYGGPRREYVGLSAMMAVMGPFGTVVTAFASNFWQYGWTLTTCKKRESK